MHVTQDDGWSSRGSCMGEIDGGVNTKMALLAAGPFSFLSFSADPNTKAVY